MLNFERIKRHAEDDFDYIMNQFKQYYRKDSCFAFVANSFIVDDDARISEKVLADVIQDLALQIIGISSNKDMTYFEKVVLLIRLYQTLSQNRTGFINNTFYQADSQISSAVDFMKFMEITLGVLDKINIDTIAADPKYRKYIN